MNTPWLQPNYRSLAPGRLAPRRFAPGRRPIQRFVLIQLKPKHHRLDVLTTHVTVCVGHVMLN